MRLVIAGSPQAGQQQLFSVLTGIPLGRVQERPLEAHQGSSEVRDPRIDKLSSLYNPEKTTYARIEYMLIPDFNLKGPAKDAVFGHLKNADEICWIARSEGAEKDVSDFLSELAIADLILVDRRLETISKNKSKRSAQETEKEKQLLESCRKQLESGEPLFDAAFSPEQMAILRSFQLLTIKPIILVINVPEDRIRDRSVSENIGARFKLPCVQLSAELEEEIGKLGSEEGYAFMKEMGIEEPALHKMTRMAFRGLGLITFFTVGEDEVRSWPIRQGSTAQEAGGAIHSDIKKGFVRAEMMKFEDLVHLGSEAKVKEAGKFILQGRDYIVHDGDILSFRFNV